MISTLYIYIYYIISLRATSGYNREMVEFQLAFNYELSSIIQCAFQWEENHKMTRFHDDSYEIYEMRAYVDMIMDNSAGPASFLLDAMSLHFWVFHLRSHRTHRTVQLPLSLLKGWIGKSGTNEICFAQVLRLCPGLGGENHGFPWFSMYVILRVGGVKSQSLWALPLKTELHKVVWPSEQLPKRLVQLFYPLVN